ncbi:MAG: PaREP1 family protein [Chloroflexota bacterium]|nr:PaREP1 family protein [Chloroflexota bacterium]
MTTNYGRSVEDYTAQALKFLAQSDAEFAAGDDRQGAEKLYGAATQAVIAASKRRGWGYRSHRANKNAIRRLADEYGDPFLVSGFNSAERFHIHFHHGDMEEYDIVTDRPAVHAYVQRVVDLINDYELNGHSQPQG